MRKLNGKWRIVEAGTDKLATRNGRAVDGGGHQSKDNALAQVGAINSSLEKRKKRHK